MTRPADCQTCDGTSLVEELDHTEPDGTQHTVTFPCPECGPRDEYHTPLLPGNVTEFRSLTGHWSDSPKSPVDPAVPAASGTTTVPGRGSEPPARDSSSCGDADDSRVRSPNWSQPACRVTHRTPLHEGAPAAVARSGA